jgi:tripartite-type tricarboxylate transporter receptor subunit TctC
MAFDAFTPDSPMFQRFRFAAALAVLSSCLFALPALAQEWPQAGKTIQLIVPAPGGSGTGDTIARVLAEELQSRLKATFVVDNKAGANGNIGASAAAATAGDGYHFLFSWAGTLAVNKALYKNLSFDAQKDFVPILLVADVPNILVVNNDIPAKDLADFERYAKANPGKLNFGSTGIGSSMHLAGELFMRETGAQMTHVPYNAPGTATTNLIAGEIQLMFQLIPGIAGQVKSGKVRAIAVMAPQRSPALPDVPTTAELGQPRLLSSTWFALLAPKGTPPAVIARMNAVSNEILADPAVKKRLAEMGASTLGGTSQQLAEHLAAETEKWGRVVRDARISAQ